MVNGNFDGLVAERQAAGNAHGVKVTERRRLEALADCDQMERGQQDKRMVIAYRRLGAVMDALIAGTTPAPAALKDVSDDLEAIRGFNRAPYRDAYLQRHAEYLRLAQQGPTAAQRAAPHLEPPPEPPAPNPQRAASPDAAGRLRGWGAYLGIPAGQTVTQLANGSVLLVGHGHPLPDTDDPGVVSHQLRERRKAGPVGTVESSPRLWDSARRGWVRLPSLPECPGGQRTLHTTTVLPDDKVLISGGLCDMPRFADDKEPYPPFAALSFWDAKARSWVAAGSLREPRLRHTASLLADGSVLLVGGESDPALVAATASGEPVLASAERYQQGRMAAAAPLGTARAGHTATVLADGNVLVIGGFDAAGRALRSTEHWITGDAAWRELAAPKFARHSHAATRLADGNVLVTGGVGVDGQRLTSSELWDPQSMTWRAVPSLPLPLAGHAATLLADGRVLVAGGTRLANIGAGPWAWVWRPGESEWRVAGSVDSNALARNADPVTLVPRPDGGALAFTGSTIMRWDPMQLPPDATPPLWQAAPTATLLADGRMMFVGVGMADNGSTQSAYLWEPAGNRWREAGRLTAGVRLRAGTVSLPSGRLLHVALDGDGRFVCDTWESADNRWRGCGSAAIEYPVPVDVQAGLLSDGRAVVLVNQLEALVFDERQQTWASWKPEWKTASLAFGAPIRSETPLARVRDPASGSWFEINDAAARWRQLQFPERLHWDPQAGLWAYVLQDMGPAQMGRHEARLPDGCIISATPSALFEPGTGKARALADPGLGMEPGMFTMRVLPDGTVVFAGVSKASRDPGAGFLRRKASCKGWEADPELATYINGDVAVDLPAAVPAPAAATTPLAAPWHRQALDWAGAHRWLLLASGGPLVGWLLLRRLPVRRVQVGPAWVLRALVYGGLLVWSVPTLLSYTIIEVAHKVEDCRDDPVCALKASTAKGGALPCRLIGVWSSRQGNRMRRIELKDDGSYLMAAGEAGADPAAGYKGRWLVEGKNMHWRHDGISDLDINPMQADGPERFTLTEVNGATTRFELIRAVPSTRCSS